LGIKSSRKKRARENSNTSTAGGATSGSGTSAENSAQISIKSKQYARFDMIWLGLTRVNLPILMHLGTHTTPNHLSPEDGKHGFGTAM